MSVLFSLLIATNGVVLGVVLRSPIGGQIASATSPAADPTRPTPLVVLLVLPVVSYLITVRYTYLYLGTLRIGAYIDRRLAPRIPGGIEWENWLSDSKLKTPRISQVIADSVAFVGTSVVGLIGAAYALWELKWSVAWCFWLACLILTVMTARAVYVRHRARDTFSKLPREPRDADPSGIGGD